MDLKCESDKARQHTSVKCMPCQKKRRTQGKAASHMIVLHLYNKRVYLKRPVVKIPSPASSLCIFDVTNFVHVYNPTPTLLVVVFLPTSIQSRLNIMQNAERTTDIKRINLLTELTRPTHRTSTLHFHFHFPLFLHTFYPASSPATPPPPARSATMGHICAPLLVTSCAKAAASRASVSITPFVCISP